MLEYWADFFEELQTVRGRSQNTVLAYRRDLEVYADFLSMNLPIESIFDYFQKKQLSPRSQGRLISSIRSYLKFCERQGLRKAELRVLKQPKAKKSLPKVLTMNQFVELQLAAVVDNERQTLRNQLVLSMLFGSGCRVSELILLNISDYNSMERWIKVTGKAGRERLVPLNDLLVQALNQYLEKVRPFLTPRESEALLINDRGRRPSRVDIWRWLASWSVKAGFSEPVSPHQFRHGCATALLDSGADLRSIQLLLGHSSIQTTQIYTSVSQQHLRDAIAKYHPLNDYQNDTETSESLSPTPSSPTDI